METNLLILSAIMVSMVALFLLYRKLNKGLEESKAEIERLSKMTLEEFVAEQKRLSRERLRRRDFTIYCPDTRKSINYF